MTGQINIHDVARLANVSPTTVSNVLNERFERMRPATVERVMKAIEQLSYTPNRLAQQLKTGNVSLIGLIVPSVSNPFWGMVARNVEDVAHKYGYQLLLCNAERDQERERRYAEVLWSSGVRGVIFGSSPLSIDYLTPLVEKGLQVIAFDRQVQSADSVVFDSIGVDNIFGAQLAVKHLLGLGHRRIGLLSGPMRTVSRLERLEGYQLALREAGSEPDPELIWEGSPTSGFGDIESVELGRKGAHVLLGRSNRPTALFTVRDPLG